MCPKMCKTKSRNSTQFIDTFEKSCIALQISLNSFEAQNDVCYHCFINSISHST